ncbi:MAG TPA: UPF0175 family protein [Thermoanaerobaculia bacterium]|nr:UPF0175 family protein [Thermoanaerobaculia bacterium]
MKVLLEVPESLAERLSGSAESLSRAALEALVVEAYRQHRISGFELRQLLEIESRVEMDRFLKRYDVPLEYTIEDFDAESATSSLLRNKRRAEHR